MGYKKNSVKHRKPILNNDIFDYKSKEENIDLCDEDEYIFTDMNA